VSTIALLLAAGSGDRLGGDVPKAFVELAGRPLVGFSLEAIAVSGAVDGVVVMVPPGQVGTALSVLGALRQRRCVVDVVEGGRSRQETVRLGLSALSPEVGTVVCHDAARPFASAALFARVLTALSEYPEADGAVPVVPTPDTVKRVRDGWLVETIPRDELGLAQTPQVFAAGALREAHERAATDPGAATDDAMLMEAAGFRVIAVEGEAANFKVTTPEDLRRAESFLAGRG
jgi:2-C-methyl-D-erythritol 4-phosphate cytidylyltransferase